MILDRIEHAAGYYVLGPRIAKALRFLGGRDQAQLPDGRIEIEGDRIYAVVSGYETGAGTAGGVWEAHRNYIDIQCVITGVEKVGYAGRSSLEVMQAYDPARDCELLKGMGQFFILRPSVFVIFFPQDAHMPGRAAGRPCAVKKAVVKVRV